MNSHDPFHQAAEAAQAAKEHERASIEAEMAEQAVTVAVAVAPDTDSPAQEVHTAPPKVKFSFWQRIMNKGGSFLFLSIAFHVVLIIIATTYVVQTIAAKEKLKFTGKATLGSPGQKSLEYKVQTVKRNQTMSAPAAATRITSSASNVKVSIPDAPVSSSSTSAMPSMMGGMGGTGFAGGAAGAGSAGGGMGVGGAMAAMTPGAFTVFGFKGVGGGAGMRGHLYDLKQNPKKEPNENDSNDRGQALKNILAISSKNFDQKLLSQYFVSPAELMATRFWIPNDRAALMPESFGVEKDVKATMLILHYKAKVSPPKDGWYRFVGYGDDFIGMKWNGKVIMSFDQNNKGGRKYFSGEETEASYVRKGGHVVTEKIRLETSKAYEMEVFLCEWPGGLATFSLMVERDEDKDRYKKIKVEGKDVPIIPIFETDISQPIPEYTGKPGTPTLLPPHHPERLLWKVHKE